MDWIFGVFIFLLGITIGSFLNVCIYRVPLERSIAKGFSACPECGTRLTAADLVPVFSYAALRGKCRHCGCRISPVYPLVEAATGILFVLLYIKYGLSWDLLIYAALASLQTDSQAFKRRIAALGEQLLPQALENLGWPGFSRILARR